MRKDLPDEVEPSIPNADAIKELMEEFRRRDQSEAPSAIWFFCGVLVIIFLFLVSIMLISCNVTLIDSQYEFIRYKKDESVQDSENFDDEDEDEKSYIEIPNKVS